MPVRIALGLPAVAGVALLALLPAQASGNGRVVQFERKTAGPYEVALGTIPPSPVIGNLHLTMTVTDPSTESPATVTDITISATGPGADEADIEPIPVRNNPADPRSYDANVNVDREGTWDFTITIDGPMGEGTAHFPIEVRTASPLVGIATLLVLLAFLVILGLSARSYLASRRGGNRSGRRPRHHTQPGKRRQC